MTISTEPPPAPRRWSGRIVGALGLIVAAGAALRLAGMFDDLWLDEIWGWGIARQLDGVADIFSRENRIHPNQPLNTFLLYIMGDQYWWPIYRVPVVLMGAAAVAVVAWWTSTRSNAECIGATLAAAVSYPLVFYSSELRGYSAALLFMMLAIVALERHGARWTWPVVFGVSAVLGSLAHLLFLPLYAVLALWSAVMFLRRMPGRQAISSLAAYHLVPAVFLLIYFFGFVLGQAGSSTPASLGQTLLATLSLAAGTAPKAAWAGAVMMIVVGILGLMHLRRGGGDWWLLFVLVIVVSPAMIIVRAILSDELKLLTSRHLIASVMMLVVLLGLVVGHWWNRGERWRVTAVVLMILFASTNLHQIGQFVSAGRGNYLAAVQVMAQHTPGTVIRVASDHPLRGGMVLQFYERYALEKQFHFMRSRRPGEAAADWLVVHGEIPPEAKLAVQHHFGGGDPYVLVDIFPHYGLSGFTWELYQRVLRE
jgi:hypothetical protein